MQHVAERCNPPLIDSPVLHSPFVPPLLAPVDSHQCLFVRLTFSGTVRRSLIVFILFPLPMHPRAPPIIIRPFILLCYRESRWREAGFTVYLDRTAREAE